MATHQDAEIYLLLMRGARRIGVEIKRSGARALTRPFLHLPWFLDSVYEYCVVA